VAAPPGGSSACSAPPGGGNARHPSAFPSPKNFTASSRTAEGLVRLGGALEPPSPAAPARQRSRRGQRASEHHPWGGPHRGGRVSTHTPSGGEGHPRLPCHIPLSLHREGAAGRRRCPRGRSAVRRATVVGLPSSPGRAPDAATSASREGSRLRPRVHEEGREEAGVTPCTHNHRARRFPAWCIRLGRARCCFSDESAQGIGRHLF